MPKSRPKRPEMTIIGYLKSELAAAEARRLTDLTGVPHFIRSNTPAGPFFVDRERTPTPRSLNAEKGDPSDAVDKDGGFVMFVIWVDVRDAPGLAVVRRTVATRDGLYIDEEFDAFDTPELARRFIQATYPSATLLQGQGEEPRIFEVWAIASHSSSSPPPQRSPASS